MLQALNYIPLGKADQKSPPSTACAQVPADIRPNTCASEAHSLSDGTHEGNKGNKEEEFAAPGRVTSLVRYPGKASYLSDT